MGGPTSYLLHTTPEDWFASQDCIILELYTMLVPVIFSVSVFPGIRYSRYRYFSVGIKLWREHLFKISRELFFWKIPREFLFFFKRRAKCTVGFARNRDIVALVKKNVCRMYRVRMSAHSRHRLLPPTTNHKQENHGCIKRILILQYLIHFWAKSLIWDGEIHSECLLQSPIEFFFASAACGCSFLWGLFKLA